MRKGKHQQVFHDHALSSRPATEGCCQGIQYLELGDYIYHLLTETEGTVCFVDHKTHCFPEVSVNKCFVIQGV
jgi:hypothetical protein